MVPRVCVEHTYQDVHIDQYIDVPALAAALDFWTSLGHAVYEKRKGYGTIQVAYNPTNLDIYGWIMGGPTVLGTASRPKEKDCSVTLRDEADVQLMVHELGHCLCYGHSDDPESVMYPTYIPGQWKL